MNALIKPPSPHLSVKLTLTLLTALLLAPLALLHAQKAPLWVLPEVAAPRVQRVLFDSKAAGRQVSSTGFTCRHQSWCL